MRIAPALAAVVAALCSASRVCSGFPVAAGAVLRLDRRVRGRKPRLRQRQHHRHHDQWRHEHELEPNYGGLHRRRPARCELSMEPHGLRGRSGRRRFESEDLQQYAHRDHVLICNGARSHWLCIRPASLLRDWRWGYVQFSSSGTTTDSTGAPVTTTGTSRRTAWVAGAGTESAVTPNVILRLEFLYLQLLDNTQNSASATPAISSERVYNIIGRVGLSYKFGWGG